MLSHSNQHSIVSLLLLLLAVVSPAACIPTPAENEAFVPAVILHEMEAERLRNRDCLMAGLSQTISASGVLVCVRNYGDSCYPDLMLSDAGKRATLLAAIDSIYWNYSPACSTPATNATSDLNALSLPAHALMTMGGGTTGTHRSGLNFAMDRVDSCDGIGMQNPAFLGGAATLADEGQMSFLTSPAGLVAVQDSTGTCRSAMGLNASQASAVTGYRNGTLALVARCDYGVDDSSLTDCPASLRNSSYMFSGITTW